MTSNMKLKWLSNTYDPTMPDAPLQVIALSSETMQEAWQTKREWLKGKVIGDPQTTVNMKYTVDELKAMHLVGVYVKDGDE